MARFECSELEGEFENSANVSVAAYIPVEIRDAIKKKRTSISRILRNGLYFLIEDGRLELPGIELPKPKFKDYSEFFKRLGFEACEENLEKWEKSEL